MKHSTRLRALALVGVVGLATGAAGCSKHGDHHEGGGHGHGPGTMPPPAAMTPLTDLQPTTANPTDGASASVKTRATENSTTVMLRVAGFAPALAGTVLGAHVHTGPCTAGDGAAAGPHFSAGQPPSKTTEVWLDLTVDDKGRATSTATVPFVIPAGGAKSVVIHEKATAADGTAGARFACLPFTPAAD